MDHAALLDALCCYRGAGIWITLPRWTPCAAIAARVSGSRCPLDALGCYRGAGIWITLPRWTPCERDPDTRAPIAQGVQRDSVIQIPAPLQQHGASNGAT